MKFKKSILTSILSFTFLLNCFLLKCAQANEPLPKPELYGKIVVPSDISKKIEFGGISDLSYDAKNNTYLAISDDRAKHAPARFYRLKFALTKPIKMEIVSTHSLTNVDGQLFEKGEIDPEGIALNSDRIIWSSEGDEDGLPELFIADLNGKGIQNIPLPHYYLQKSRHTGIYKNLGPEGLTLSKNGDNIIVAMENALQQDGEQANIKAGSPARLLIIDTKTLKPTAEYLYQTEPVFARLKSILQPWQDNGISAITSLPDGRLIVVERAFVGGVGNKINFFIVDLNNAYNILGKEKVTPNSVKKVHKNRWFTLNEGDFGLDLDNIESIAFGAKIDGKASFVIASDNNFSSKQVNQFIFFTIPEKP